MQERNSLKAMQKRIKKTFTLLEVMIVIAILAITAGAVAWRMQDAVRKKEFTSQVEKFRTKVIAVQKLALSMQADWQGTLTLQGDEWVFETVSEEGRKLAPLKLKSVSVFVDGKKQKGPILFDFFSTGQVLPVGEIVFKKNQDQEVLKLPEIFEKKEGQTEGPTQPE